MAAELLTERPSPHTMVLTISDPAARNALSPQVYAAGVESLDSAAEDPSIRCVIIRGAGDHFCAGGDLQRMKATRALGPAEGMPIQHQSVNRLASLVETIQTFPKPVVAAVEGFAAGAGFSLALACDLVVAAEDAKFVMSYGRVGLSPDGGGSWQLVRRLPLNLALECMWLAEPMPASRAASLGLVNRMVGKGQAYASALALADQLATMAPNALASAKELAQHALSHPLSDQLQLEAQHFVANVFNANAGEGMAAFFDKRAPRFE